MMVTGSSIFILLTLFIHESTQLYTKSLNWNNHADGTYTDALAKSDFGAVTGWNSARTLISGQTARITLQKDAVTEASGVQAKLDLPSGTAYELDFDVKFHTQFNWSRGGKVGFGFGIGNANTGCNVPTDGGGGSLRIMWYQDDNERVYFHPYVYHVGMTGKCGDNFGKSYPKTGSLEKGKWYKVHMYLKSNTGKNTDGHVQIKINGVPLLDQQIRWTTNDAKRFVTKLFFHTFRGGKEDHWKSPTNDYIYYDNLSVKQLS